MILGPLLLELGAHPVAAAATSGLLVLGSSGSAVLDFGLDGRVDWVASGFFAALCAAASLVGTLVVGRIVQRSGRASLVVFILAVVVRHAQPWACYGWAMRLRQGSEVCVLNDLCVLNDICVLNDLCVLNKWPGLPSNSVHSALRCLTRSC